MAAGGRGVAVRPLAVVRSDAIDSTRADMTLVASSCCFTRASSSGSSRGLHLAWPARSSHRAVSPIVRLRSSTASSRSAVARSRSGVSRRPFAIRESRSETVVLQGIDVGDEDARVLRRSDDGRGGEGAQRADRDSDEALERALGREVRADDEDHGHRHARGDERGLVGRCQPQHASQCEAQQDEQEDDQGARSDDRHDDEGDRGPQEGPEGLEDRLLGRMVEGRPGGHGGRDGRRNRVGERDRLTQDVRDKGGESGQNGQAGVSARP